MDYRNLHKIILSILIIGLINLYNIFKFGIILNIPSQYNCNSESIKEGKGGGIKELIIEKGIFKLDINSIKIMITISVLIFLIFNYITWPRPELSSGPRSMEGISIGNIDRGNLECGEMGNKDKETKRTKVEYEILIGLGLLGLIIIIISNDLISIYLGLELYSFSIYVLILVKETLSLGRISIIYLIISSLSSALLLLSFSYFYQIFGTFNYDSIFQISHIFCNIPLSKISKISGMGGDSGIGEWSGYEENKIIFLILIALLFKLGSGPFVYWLIRLYSDLDKRIFWYQLTVPKLVFFLLLVKFLTLFSFQDLQFLSFFSYFLFLIAIISIIIGAIGGLFQERDNMLLTYSSILNIGFILLTLALFILNFSPNSLGSLNTPGVTLGLTPGLEASLDLQSLVERVGQGLESGTWAIKWEGFKGLESLDKFWILYQYFFVYFINLLGIFSIFFLYRRTSSLSLFNSFFLHPFFFISFFLLILSFIGIPPFSGFFSKFYLFFSLFSYSSITFFSLAIFLLFTIISSIFYLKFLFSSSTSSPFSPLPQDPLLSQSHPHPVLNNSFNLLSSNTPTFASFLLSFSTLFSLSYPFFLSFFIPFFNLS